MFAEFSRETRRSLTVVAAEVQVRSRVRSAGAERSPPRVRCVSRETRSVDADGVFHVEREQPSPEHAFLIQDVPGARPVGFRPGQDGLNPSEA